MQTLPVHYTDRIWGFQAQLVKTVTRAEIKVITGKNHSSGSAEGFNTIIRLLIKQSYGIRDFKYLRLKIHDLPSRRIKTHI